jgi:16S rRNA (guanine966-N2)-methyltransferase
MRIVAGSLGGRTFEAPRGHRTHPMSEKIRGALFNALGDIKGLSLLDAYAGSGGVALEAVSRGAKYVLALEADKNAYDIIVKNRDALNVDPERLAVYFKRCESWSRQNKDTTFDVVVADPPFDLFKYKMNGMELIAKNVAPGGIYVASIPPSSREHIDHMFSYLSDMKLLFDKQYGDAQLIFYKRM